MTPEVYRTGQYYRVGDRLAEAGLEAPKVSTDILWTSMDVPVTMKDLECDAFDTEECLAPGSSMASSDAQSRSPVFASAVVFDRIARQSPRCGDCLLKLVLNQRRAGLGPVLPRPTKKPQQRDTVLKALMRFQYTIVQHNASFYMVTDAEQARHILLKPCIKHGKTFGHICLSNDVVTEDESELEALNEVMKQLFEGCYQSPVASRCRRLWSATFVRLLVRNDVARGGHSRNAPSGR